MTSQYIDNRRRPIIGNSPTVTLRALSMIQFFCSASAARLSSFNNVILFSFHTHARERVREASQLITDAITVHIKLKFSPSYCSSPVGATFVFGTPSLSWAAFT